MKTEGGIHHAIESGIAAKTVLLHPLLVRNLCSKSYDFCGTPQDLARFVDYLKTLGVFNGN